MSSDVGIRPDAAAPVETHPFLVPCDQQLSLLEVAR